jgi:E3 ubiquitin-protein ligase TRIP12
MVDLSLPVCTYYPPNRGKKALMHEERLTAIERDNRILLERMSDIVYKPHYSYLSGPSPSARQERSSLNKTQRKKDLIRITMENQMIWKRIQEQRTAYSFDKFRSERKNQEKFLKLISEFPYEPSKTAYIRKCRTSEKRQAKTGRHSQDVMPPLERRDPKNTTFDAGDFFVTNMNDQQNASMLKSKSFTICY